MKEPQQQFNWAACGNEDCGHDIEFHSHYHGCSLCKCKRYEQRMGPVAE